MWAYAIKLIRVRNSVYYSMMMNVRVGIVWISRVIT